MTSVLASEEFAGSERRRALLKYLVEETLEGRGDQLKAYKIGRAALGRPKGFDPQTDPIVRVEIGRLRATLDRYYRAHPDPPIVIAIPKGRYRAEFSKPSRTAPLGRDGTHSSVVVRIEPIEAASRRGQELADGISQAIATLIAARTRNPSSVIVVSPSADDSVDDNRVRACRIRGRLRCVDGRVRLTVETYLPGADRPVSRIDLDESTSGRHEFDLVDRLAERVAWVLLDEAGAMARNGVWLTQEGLTPEVRSGQQRYYDAFDTADPTELADAARVLESTAVGESSDARSAAALSDTLTTSWFLSAELEIGVLDRAEHLAVHALALDPDLVEAHLALGYVHFARGRSQLITHEFDVALRLAPPSPSVLHAQAIVYALDGSWERADQMMTRAAALNPQLPKYWRLVPCVAALHRDEFDRAYTESLQIGDAIGWAGPALRLACALPLGVSLHEDVKQFLATAPDPTAQAYEDTVARTFHDPLVHGMIIAALEAGIASAV